ncbi:Zinc finger protein 587 [Myotis brandtii]|uniref:Zinc finger protein 587 n=1 Tax=Myotis brandtii TaxID=109478 RepID=S7PTA9_MYOBR|nr:Zinc finger protein 587 [Myotis brandtii]
MAAAVLRCPTEVGVTFEDVAVYFSRTEWHLLNEAQRHLYLDVMLENFALISSLGCCCGTQDLEASIEQNVSVRVSQAKNNKVALSSQKSHPCESCGAVLRDIFQLVEQRGTQHSLQLLREFTLEKSYMSVVNVGNPLATVPTSLHNREFTLVKSLSLRAPYHGDGQAGPAGCCLQAELACSRAALACLRVAAVTAKQALLAADTPEAAEQQGLIHYWSGQILPLRLVPATPGRADRPKHSSGGGEGAGRHHLVAMGAAIFVTE